MASRISPSLQMVEARKADMTPGNAEPWLIASSSCFPVFPLCEIDGQNYIDGGYADNLPISTAFRLGAERVIAVALKPEAFEKSYPRHPLVKRIVPSRPLGPFLDFSRDVLDRNLRLGYVDTMRAFGCYLGNQYSFEKSGEAALLNAARKYLLWLLRLELNEPESAVQAVLERFSGNTKLSDTLFAHDRGDLLSAALAALEYVMSLRKRRARRAARVRARGKADAHQLGRAAQTARARRRRQRRRDSPRHMAALSARAGNGGTECRTVTIVSICSRICTTCSRS